MANEIFKTIMQYSSWLLAFTTLLIMVIRPLREKILGIRKKERSEYESLKCLLRSEIVRIYFQKRKNACLHQYEFENISMLYSAYKELGGNSFVDRIWEEIQEWEIIP